MFTSQKKHEEVLSARWRWRFRNGVNEWYKSWIISGLDPEETHDVGFAANVRVKRRNEAVERSL